VTARSQLRSSVPGMGAICCNPKNPRSFKTLKPKNPNRPPLRAQAHTPWARGLLMRHLPLQGLPLFLIVPVTRRVSGLQHAACPVPMVATTHPPTLRILRAKDSKSADPSSFLPQVCGANGRGERQHSHRGPDRGIKCKFMCMRCFTCWGVQWLAAIGAALLSLCFTYKV
jgi:hypothetical protein